MATIRARYEKGVLTPVSLLILKRDGRWMSTCPMTGNGGKR